MCRANQGQSWYKDPAVPQLRQKVGMTVNAVEGYKRAKKSRNDYERKEREWVSRKTAAESAVHRIMPSSLLGKKKKIRRR